MTALPLDIIIYLQQRNLIVGFFIWKAVGGAGMSKAAWEGGAPRKAWFLALLGPQFALLAEFSTQIPLPILSGLVSTWCTSLTARQTRGQATALAR